MVTILNDHVAAEQVVVEVGVAWVGGTSGLQASLYAHLSHAGGESEPEAATHALAGIWTGLKALAGGKRPQGGRGGEHGSEGWRASDVEELIVESNDLADHPMHGAGGTDEPAVDHPLQPQVGGGGPGGARQHRGRRKESQDDGEDDTVTSCATEKSSIHRGTESRPEG